MGRLEQRGARLGGGRKRDREGHGEREELVREGFVLAESVEHDREARDARGLLARRGAAPHHHHPVGRAPRDPDHERDDALAQRANRLPARQHAPAAQLEEAREGEVGLQQRRLGRQPQAPHHARAALLVHVHPQAVGRDAGGDHSLPELLAHDPGHAVPVAEPRNAREGDLTRIGAGEQKRLAQQEERDRHDREDHGRAGGWCLRAGLAPGHDGEGSGARYGADRAESTGDRRPATPVCKARRPLHFALQ